MLLKNNSINNEIDIQKRLIEFNSKFSSIAELESQILNRFNTDKLKYMSL